MANFDKYCTPLFYKGIVIREMRVSDAGACRIFPFFIDKGSFKNKDFFPSKMRVWGVVAQLAVMLGVVTMAHGGIINLSQIGLRQGVERPP
jgi:hypothetical protein